MSIRIGLVDQAILNIGDSMSRKEVVRVNKDQKLVEGFELTAAELEKAWENLYKGKSYMFPELHSLKNIDENERKSYWGELYDYVKRLTDKG